jgi:hypothetical protein
MAVTRSSTMDKYPAYVWALSFTSWNRDQDNDFGNAVFVTREKAIDRIIISIGLCEEEGKVYGCADDNPITITVYDRDLAVKITPCMSRLRLYISLNNGVADEEWCHDCYRLQKCSVV